MHGARRLDAGQTRPTIWEVVVGLVTMALVGSGGALILIRVGLNPKHLGLILSAWSGIAGFAAFGTAWLVRRRPLQNYGLRATTTRWLLLGTVAGLIAFAVKTAVVLLTTYVTGAPGNPQTIYAAGAVGGTGSLILTTLFLGVLTPLGEEFFFRGVVTNGLLQLGRVAGVVGGALVFALAHGINIVFPVALLLGLVAGELFRRSNSVWPAVGAHIVYNLPTIPLMLLAQTS